MDEVSGKIHRDVADMYEAFPYPYYPLFVRLQWQDGYVGAMNLAQQLLIYQVGKGRPPRHLSHDKPQILIIGAGEVLPYILRHIEPKQHQMTALDLSNRSLTRARIRLFACSKTTTFVRGDIDPYLKQRGPNFQHMDAYGVLTCLANPSETLKAMASRLAPSGTIRLMVYNRKPRRWINHIQKAFRLLGLDILEPKDLKDAQKLLFTLKTHSEPLHTRLALMGTGTIRNKSRLVDTFFHKREIQIDLSQWLQMIDEAGLKSIGLFDRYGELDDLPNPLNSMPAATDLETRAEDSRFENNLELFLCHKEPAQPPRRQASSQYHWLRCPPPNTWFDQEETAAISFLVRQKIWYRYCQNLEGKASKPLDDLMPHIGLAAGKRLCRLGAILPGQIADATLWQDLQAPLTQIMPKREFGIRAPLLAATALKLSIQEILIRKGTFTPSRVDQILRRFDAAQEP